MHAEVKQSEKEKKTEPNKMKRIETRRNSLVWPTKVKEEQEVGGEGEEEEVRNKNPIWSLFFS